MEIENLEKNMVPAGQDEDFSHLDLQMEES